MPGKYVPVTPQSPNEIRPFFDKEIERSMKRALSNLEEGKRGALVLYGDREGINGAIYARKPGKFFGILPAGEWSFVGTMGRTWTGQLHGGAAVGFSW